MLNVYCDGIFDLFHKGHLNHLKKIKEYFSEDIFLVVGVINDEESEKYKRKPIFSEQKRKKILDACMYTDKVIITDTLIITEEFMEKNNIDYIFHAFSDKKDINKQIEYYEIPVKLNKFIHINYNHGISTTQIIKESKLNWDDIWIKKGDMSTEDLYLLNGWEDTKFEPKDCVSNIINKLSINPENSVIEIGCGSGLLSQYFNKEKYMGIDKSRTLINKNIKILNSTVINFSSTDIVFKNNYFDYCICWSVLEYLKDYDELNNTINNMERITKTGLYIGSIRFKTRVVKEKKHKYNGVFRHFTIPKQYFIDRNYTVVDNKYSDERYDVYKIKNEI